MEPITYTNNTTDEVRRVINNIFQVIEDEDEDLVVKALYAMALKIQAPSLTLKQIIDGVKGVSEWTHLYATSFTPTEIAN